MTKFILTKTLLPIKKCEKKSCRFVDSRFLKTCDDNVKRPKIFEKNLLRRFDVYSVRSNCVAFSQYLNFI